MFFKANEATKRNVELRMLDGPVFLFLHVFPPECGAMNINLRFMMKQGYVSTLRIQSSYFANKALTSFK